MLWWGTSAASVRSEPQRSWRLGLKLCGGNRKRHAGDDARDFIGLSYTLKEKVSWKPGFRRWFASSPAQGRSKKEGRGGRVADVRAYVVSESERGVGAPAAQLGSQQAGPGRGIKAVRGGKGMLGRGRGRKLGRAAAALAFLFFFFFFFVF